MGTPHTHIPPTSGLSASLLAIWCGSFTSLLSWWVAWRGSDVIPSRDNSGSETASCCPCCFAFKREDWSHGYHRNISSSPILIEQKEQCHRAIPINFPPQRQDFLFLSIFFYWLSCPSNVFSFLLKNSGCLTLSQRRSFKKLEGRISTSL